MKLWQVACFRYCIVCLSEPKVEQQYAEEFTQSNICFCKGYAIIWTKPDINRTTSSILKKNADKLYKRYVTC